MLVRNFILIMCAVFSVAIVYLGLGCAAMAISCNVAKKRK